MCLHLHHFVLWRKTNAAKASPPFPFLFSHQVSHFKSFLLEERQRNRSIIKKAWKEQKTPQFFEEIPNLFRERSSPLLCPASDAELGELTCRVSAAEWQSEESERKQRMKYRDRDATQAVRSPRSDCVKRERGRERERAIVCEREEGEEGEGGGDRVRREIRRRGGQRGRRKQEWGVTLRSRQVAPSDFCHQHFFPRLVTSSPLLLPLLQRSLAPACWC